MRIAIAVPCFNEAPTVGKVVEDFRRELPDAEIVVFDNASTDATGDEAVAAGARVVLEKRPGKGYVMQSFSKRSMPTSSSSSMAMTPTSPKTCTLCWSRW